MKPRTIQAPLEPWHMPEVPDAIAYAWKALAAGKANQGQQIRLLSWLCFDLCKLHKSAFDPRSGGVDGQRVTDFVLGMQAVGHVIARTVEKPLKPEGQETMPADPRGVERTS